MQYITTLRGIYGSGRFDNVIADDDGNAVMTLVMHYMTTPGPDGGFELTNTKADGSKIVIEHPYTAE
jgi:hypothetical protein